MVEYTNIREYAEWVLNKLPKFGMIPHLGNDIVSGHGGLLAITWHRHKQFMTQLYIARPNMILPQHKHPNVDDINVILGGQIHPSHNGKWCDVPYLMERLNKETNESKVEDEWYKLQIPSKGQMEWWIKNSDTPPHPLRGIRCETKADTPHGVQFGPGGGCFLTCQHWLNGNPTCIMDDHDVDVIQSQDKLTWKDVAKSEIKDWPMLDTNGKQIKIEE